MMKDESNSVKSDKEIVMEAINIDAGVSQTGFQKLIDDREVNAQIIDCVRSEMDEEDKKSILEVVKNNYRNFLYASEDRWKENKEFLYEIKDKLLEFEGFNEAKENLSRYEHEDKLLKRMQENNSKNPLKQQVSNIVKKKV